MRRAVAPALVALLLLAPPATACPRKLRVRLHAFFDLPRGDERSHGLSGLTWSGGTFYAVGDRRPAILTLVPDANLTRFSFGESLPVELGGRRWDVEALAVAGEQIYLGNESGPWVHIVDRAGKLTGDLPLPASFARSRPNHGLESLAVTPDEQTLFAANEQAADGDGGVGDSRRGTLVRLTRIGLGPGANAPVQFLYRSDPVFSKKKDGRIGVSDLIAVSPSRVLVLERTYVPTVGNSVRLYCADLPAKPGAAPVKKTLFVDVGRLPDAAAPLPDQPQRNRLLDNFEGMTLGPTLLDGSRALVMVSDDNTAPEQVPRVLVLAVSGL